MKYFFDTEFIEWAGGIQLVSIGIVREDGRMFYAESCTFDERLADQWVKDNVISKLHFNNEKFNSFWSPDGVQINVFGTETFIKEQLLLWLSPSEDETPEFYAYYASYDWVVFARIFGRLIEKPEHFPMWVIDLKQRMWERGLPVDWKRAVCPDPEGEHDALVDALWNKNFYDQMIIYKYKI